MHFDAAFLRRPRVRQLVDQDRQKEDGRHDCGRDCDDPWREVGQLGCQNREEAVSDQERNHAPRWIDSDLDSADLGDPPTLAEHVNSSAGTTSALPF